MPCSFCGTVGHNRRTCQRFDLLVAAATEEQTNIETEDNIIPDEQLRIRNNNNESLISTARSNLLNVIDDLFQYNNELNPSFITPNRSRAPSPHHSPQRPLTIQPISDYGYGAATMLLERNIPPGLTRIPSFDDIANIFNGEEDFDDLPDLIPIEPKKLVDCVDKPCSTDNCAICLDKLSSVDLLVTRCGHQFHGTCMIQHFKKKNNCPLCRGLLHV